MIKTLKRLLGQVDRTTVNPENLVYVDYRNPPKVPSGAIKVSQHVPMDKDRRSFSLEDDIILERVDPGVSLKSAIARMRLPLADAAILDSLVLARLDGSITLPPLWLNCFIVFPGTVFQGPNWTKLVSGLNMVVASSVGSMRNTHALEAPVSSDHPVYVACAAPTV